MKNFLLGLFWFQALFAENPSNHPIVILKDVKFSDLEVLVDFIYCGQVNVSEEQLPQVNILKYTYILYHFSPLNSYKLGPLQLPLVRLSVQLRVNIRHTNSLSVVSL